VIRAFGVQAAVATVENGEEFWVELRDCYDGQVHSETDLRSSLDGSRFMPITGPIEVRGAAAATCLRIEVLEIVPNEHGFMPLKPGMGVVGAAITQDSTYVIPIDVQAQVLHLGPFTVPLQPMIGCIGTAPVGKPVPASYPGAHGGNLDTRDLMAGSIVYLPVFVPGALLALGDLHAAMGDGEMCGQGVEMPGRVRLRVSTSAEPLSRPRIETPKAWITLASAATLEEALRLAAGDMLDFICQTYDVGVPVAYRLLSIAGNAGISAVVNPLMTAKVTLPKGLV
jgi:amidase